ncbi:MAG: methyltransferase [Patescibacteria group bacterium]
MADITSNKKQTRSSVNTIMSWGTIIYLVAIFAGGLADFFYHIEIISNSIAKIIGFALIVLATAIIFWAAISARRLIRNISNEVSVDVFKTGSYCFSRNPTYLGLSFLVAGLGFIANSLPILAAAFVAFATVHFTALKQEEQALEDRFGEIYRGYKREVRRWL